MNHAMCIPRSVKLVRCACLLVGAILLISVSGVELQILEPPNGTPRAQNILFQMSKQAYESKEFAYGHVPRAGGRHLYSFLRRRADISACRRNATMDGSANDADGCNFRFVSPSKDMSLSAMQLRQPSVLFLLLLRDPLIQTLSYAGNLDRHLGYDCALSSFVHTGGCLNLSEVSNMQTESLGGGDVTTAVNVLHNIFWFGIFEWFEASMCLLSIQLNQVSRDLCDCNSPSLLRMKEKKLDSLDYTSTSLIEVGAMIRKDKFLYNKGLKIFIHRIIVAENRVGFAILCPDRDSADLLQIKSLIESGLLRV